MMGRLHLMFSKDLDNTMLVYTSENGVRFTIDGKEVELDKWKVQALIQILVDFDKEVK
nr:MAG TPA: alkaline phosphatase [Caudoviricetes sp.]